MGSEKPHGHAKEQFVAQLRRLVQQSRTALAKSQARYKRDFEKRIRPQRPIEEGDNVYSERQGPAATAAPGERSKHKLLPKSEGPYPVGASTDHTVTIMRDGRNEKVSHDLVSKPPASQRR